MMNRSTSLEQLKQYTHIVVDSGDLNAIQKWNAEEATTNPSLLLKTFQSTEGASFIQAAYQLASAQSPHAAPALTLLVQACAVVLAKRILADIPGRVSLEVDAHHAFDAQATIEHAKTLIDLCQQAAIDPKRILIKIAATWEGIQAARELEQQHIACNGTLIFHETQALACAQANMTLISPFVGRIYDWHCAHHLLQPDAMDPGVQSVQQIFKRLKSQGYTTEIMGASFRNCDEILALAGCDRLTIAPQFLQQLSDATIPVSVQLTQPPSVEREPLVTENAFRWDLNQSPMATEKLAEGIRLFAQADEQLKQTITAYLTQHHQAYCTTR
jgi:transaldolase